MIKKYKSEIISIQNPIEGVYTLEFNSLNGKFKYAPGQFLHLALDPDYDGVGQWPESRCFSVQSNPSDETIKITYSVKGSFTRQMAESLKPGSEVWLKLPYGDLFTQEHNFNDVVFIAGGTGVTPYLSLFCHQSFAAYQNPKLYLGVRSRDFNIYQHEIEKAKNVNTGFKDIVVYENESGILNIKNIAVENGTTATYFISGPPVMIKNFKEYLISVGVSEEGVKTDDWE